MIRRRCLPLLGLTLAALACGGEPRSTSVTAPTPRTSTPAPAVIAPPLPASDGPLWPAMTRVEPHGDVDLGARLSEIDACGSCHPVIAAQWRESAHALASFNNPIYRVGVERFREVKGLRASRMCAGCHDPALLASGAIDAPIEPADPRAHVGVSCRTCHGITSATLDGNGSYTLTAADDLIPEEGDVESVAAHRRRQAPAALGSAAMCGACHRAFLGPETGPPHHMPGADDLGPWLASAHAGALGPVPELPLPRQGCADCHMPEETASSDDAAARRDGKLRSHRFLGGHTWLAAMRGDDEDVARISSFLAGVASVDIAAARIEREGAPTIEALPAESLAPQPGDRVLLDVVVRNLAVGHRFPGGTRDAQDTWIELAVLGADGRAIAQTDAPHRLFAHVVDDDGQLRRAREVEVFQGTIVDHTVGPRDAAVTRHAFVIPQELDEAAWPLQVTARLRHRSRSLELARETCLKGGAIDDPLRAATRARTGLSLDPCAAPPITEVAAVTLELSRAGDGQSRSDAPTWSRLRDHGLALLHQRQEHLEEAARSLTRARELLDEATPDPAMRARITLALARVAVDRGQIEEAEALLGELEGVAASRARILARGYDRVFRSGDAARLLTEHPPPPGVDPGYYVALARAEGTAGAPRAALEAARAGLSLTPRDPDLLRAAGLALDELGDDAARSALASYLHYRPADALWRLADRCERSSPACALERVAVHVHELAPPGADVPDASRPADPGRRRARVRR
ncbi:MAG: multiheme c-type cytochrome [Nannocystaceae bacterium]